MILCQVCGTKNHHLSIVCSSCGGFIQGRVDNLDLFSTVWRIIENPRTAFRSISLARYKNYSLLLTAMGGTGFIFTLFWYLKAGDYTSTMFQLVVVGFLSGPLVGVSLTLLLSSGLRILLPRFRFPVRFRNIFAVLAYAATPIALSVVFILPLEIFSFGRYFFSLNPPPWQLKPFSYYLFIILDSLVGIWWTYLMVVGLKVLLNSRWLTAFIIVAIVVLLLLSLIATAEWLLITPLNVGSDRTIRL